MKNHRNFFIISRSFVFRMRNIVGKSCRENQNTHFVLGNVFFENNVDYEKMWKNTVERRKPQMTIWRLRAAFLIPKYTHSSWVILIAFPQQQWLQESAPVLSWCRLTYSACLVIIGLRVIFSTAD